MALGSPFTPVPSSPGVLRRFPVPAPSPSAGSHARGRTALAQFGYFQCQGWAARKWVDGLAPGAITRSTLMASSLAGLAAFLQ